MLPFPYYFIEWNKENVGFDMKKYVNIAEGDMVENLIELANFKEIEDILFQRIKENKGLLWSKRLESREIAFQLTGFCERALIEKNLSGASEEELINYLKVFFSYYTTFSNQNIPFWFFAPDKIKEELVKNGLTEEEIMILSTPEEQSYSNRFEVRFLELLLKIRKKGFDFLFFDGFIEKLKKDIVLFNEFDNLIKESFWIPFNYYGPEIYNEETIFTMMKKNQLSNEELERKIAELKNSKIRLREKQKEIKKKINDDVKELGENIKMLTIMQDDKKEITTKAHFYLQNLIKEIAKRMNMDYQKVNYLLVPEIESLLLAKKRIEERSKKSISLYTPTEKEKIKIFTAEEADNFAKENGLAWISEQEVEDTKIIKGNSASKGYVLGIAKILHFPNEGDKLNKGDILVTTMTTPDFVPLMERAAGIITDEGGVTCHAAIVSREMGIPCIVGTNIATRIIKDRDYLEMNADEGIITRLTKEEYELKRFKKPENK